MKNVMLFGQRAVLLVLVALLLTGCQVAVPGCGSCRGYQPCRSPEFHLHCDPCQGGPCRPSAQRTSEGSMSVTVTPTGLMGRALLGVAKLVSNTEAFRAECGNKTAAQTLNDHCHFPDIPFDDFGNQVVGETAKLTAPLAVVSLDNGDSQAPLVQKPYAKLGSGETMLQLALRERSVDGSGTVLTDARDKFLDVANRFDAIMRELVELGASRNPELWWVNSWRLDAQALNDVEKFPFVDSGGEPCRVRIFRTVVEWRG